jgi:hypothetical protein
MYEGANTFTITHTNKYTYIHTYIQSNKDREVLDGMYESIL